MYDSIATGVALPVTRQNTQQATMAKLLSIAALAAAVALQASAHGEEQHAGSDSGAAHHEEGQEGDGMVDSANTFIRIRYYTSPSCSGSFVRDEFKEGECTGGPTRPFSTAGHEQNRD